MRKIHPKHLGARAGKRRSNERLAKRIGLLVVGLGLTLVPSAAAAPQLVEGPQEFRTLYHKIETATKQEKAAWAKQARVQGLRYQVRLWRNTTLAAQKVYGATPWKTWRAERRATNLRYLKHLKRLWHGRAKEAMDKAQAYRREQARFLQRYSGSNPNVVLGLRLARAYGWHTGYQWHALYMLWNHESGWNHRAYNPSGACGIPQSMGNCHGYDPTAQIAWGLRYIKARYSSPASALSFFYSNNWY